MHGNEQVPTVILPTLIHLASHYDVDLPSLFDQAEIPPDFDIKDDAYIEYAAFQRLVNGIIEATGRPHAGLSVAKLFSFDYLPEFQTYITTSQSLRGALKLLQWGQDLIFPFLDLEIKEKGREVQFTLNFNRDTDRQVERFISDALFSILLRLGKEHIGQEFVFNKLYLNYPLGPEKMEYEALYDSTVVDGSALSAAILPQYLLDVPWCGFPSMNDKIERDIILRVAKQKQQLTLAKRLSDWLEERPEHLLFSLAECAVALAITQRKIQRTLSKSDTSFKKLQDQAKYQRAQKLLTDTSLGVEEIAQSLGFSERRSFARAFQRWSGQVPSEYRAFRRFSHQQDKETILSN